VVLLVVLEVVQPTEPVRLVRLEPQMRDTLAEIVLRLPPLTQAVEVALAKSATRMAEVKEVMVLR
jgi:molybdenum cofactor biosynthesis enzyme MoaA